MRHAKKCMISALVFCLSVQFVIVLQFLQYQHEVLFSVACINAEYFACHYSWWWVSLPRLISVIVLAYVVYDYRHLSHQWRHMVIMILMTVIVAKWLPLLY